MRANLRAIRAFAEADITDASVEWTGVTIEAGTHVPTDAFRPHPLTGTVRTGE